METEQGAASSGDALITLNVGGVIYHTTKSTLTMHSPSYFTGLFSGAPGQDVGRGGLSDDVMTMER